MLGVKPMFPAERRVRSVSVACGYSGFLKRRRLPETVEMKQRAGGKSGQRSGQRWVPPDLAGHPPLSGG